MNGMMQSLPKLVEEAELQKMLADEKMRNEQHKTNYQILKIEHTRLKNDNAGLECERKTAQDDYTRLIEASKKAEICHKNEMDHMRAQMQLIQAQKIEKEEQLNAKIRNELEQIYKEKYIQLQVEADKYREDFNKIRYDYTFMKSEYDHLQQDYARNLGEKQMKHEAEIANHHKKLQAVQLKSSADASHNIEQLQKLRGENSHLHVKVKSLMSEIGDLRVQEQQLNSQENNTAKLHSKQIAEHLENVKNLQAEKCSLLLTKESLKNELSTCRENVASLTAQLSAGQQEINRLSGKLEETVHTLKLKETDFKMELAKHDTDSKREQNKMALAVQELNIQLEIVRGKCDQYKKKVLESELHLENRRLAIEDEEFLKVSQLETEKCNLEIELANLNSKLREKEQLLVSMEKRFEDTVTKMTDEIHELQSLNDSLRNAENMCSDMKESLEKERIGSEIKQQQISSLAAERNHLIEVQNELMRQRTTLKETLEKISSELKKSQKKLEDLNARHTKELSGLQQTLASSETNFQKKVQRIESENMNAALDFAEQQRALKNKINKYSRLITKLRNKLDLLQAKNSELEIKQEVLSDCVPKHEHEALKKKLNNIEKRHHEFRSVVTLCSQEVAGNTLPIFGVDDELQNHNRVELKTRLDTLCDQQKKEIEALSNFKSSR